MKNLRPISISTLSPVHIGCDDVYEPSNFVIADGLLHWFDPADLVAELTEAESRQLAALVEGPEPIGRLQRFFRDRASCFADLARHQVLVTPGIVDEYEKSAGKPTQRGPAGEATYNLFPIARTAFRPLDNAPYLPGSSLKGSIRTAWLNRLNRGEALPSEERRDRNNAARRLQERLLGYAAGKFEDDPFRHVGVADAHPGDDAVPPPGHVLYAISKKKRKPREGERALPELKVFLETVPDALPAAFRGELRLSGKIGWEALCDACNAFYQPQLKAELDHPVLGELIDAGWKKLVADLLVEELGDLIGKSQGFLLRVGRHSGAESVTLDGLRNIKIHGPEGGKPPDYRPNTTHKSYSSTTKAGTAGLLPFGWIWIDACEDEHAHVFDSVRRKLAARSGPLLESHRDRLSLLEEKLQQRSATAVERETRKQSTEAAARAEAAAAAVHRAALEAMSPNMRRVEEFKFRFAARARQLGSGREKLNADFHTQARSLANEALSDRTWTMEERHAAAEAIVEWLPQVVERIDKDQFKKLRIAALRDS